MQMTKISTAPFFLRRTIKVSAADHKQDFNCLVSWCSDFSVHCFAAWEMGCQGKIFTSSVTCLEIIPSFTRLLWMAQWCVYFSPILIFAPVLIQSAFRIFCQPFTLISDHSLVNELVFSALQGCGGQGNERRWLRSWVITKVQNAPHNGVCGMSWERGERGVTWLKMVPGLCISFLMCYLLTLVVEVVLYLELFIFHILETIKRGLHLALMVKVCAFHTLGL